MRLCARWNDLELGNMSYDYERQCWTKKVEEGWLIEKCGHREPMDGCFACEYHGEIVSVEKGYKV